MTDTWSEQFEQLQKLQKPVVYKSPNPLGGPEWRVAFADHRGVYNNGKETWREAMNFALSIARNGRHE